MNGDIDMKAKKGYTLIEIVVVIALLGIILSIALPNMNFYKKFMEKQEIAEFRKDLLYARSMAIIENTRYYVNFSKENNSYSINTGETSPTIKRKVFANGLKLNNNEVGHFIFNPSGAAGNSNTIYIKSNRNQMYVISLSPATSRIEINLQETE